MKFLVAIALVALVVAEVNYVSGRSLGGPRFEEGYTYKYDMTFNVTAGVLGMSSQVSASVLRADVKIRATSKTDHVLAISNIRVSDSQAAIDNNFGDIKMKKNDTLDDILTIPIKFVLKNGKVTSYTLSHKDDIETKKIKRSILRSLEMYIPEYIVTEIESSDHTSEPVMYNRTENTDFGVRTYNYIITTSPDVEFPKETAVYNVSQFDSYEGEWYPGYKLHHNFQRQGCPEVCRQPSEWKDNPYCAGCPSGFEPHHSPIKRSFSHHLSLSPVGNSFSPDVITTVETHYTTLYDQDMEVLIRYQLRKRETRHEGSGSEFNVDSKQKEYTDLHDKKVEFDEHGVGIRCSYKTSTELVQSAKDLLSEIALLIGEGKPNSPVGEKIIVVRDILSELTVADFEEVATDIVQLSQIVDRNDTFSIKRQVWMDLLPLVGTQESVKFIVKYMTSELSKGRMLKWEAKEILESLPQNIESPNEDTIVEIEKLMKNNYFLTNSLLHSAVHLTMGRLIGQICGIVPLLRTKIEEPRSWLKNIPTFQAASAQKTGLPECPTEKVLRIIEDISRKMKNTGYPEEIAIYIQALTQTEMQEALRKIPEYAHGTAENLQRLTPRHLTFMRTAVLHALHNIVGRFPEDVMEIVLPIFFNETESPKLRNAAFGVLIRSQPSQAILERVAVQSWFEKSREVGSFVTSTLETFGNSSQPCMQLLSHRIREILPQVKRFNVGLHHAKNNMWTYYNTLHNLGLEGRLEYTPNNESFIPSTLYHSLSYTMDSLKDTIYQSALNIEGLTQEDLFKKLFHYLDIKNIEKISDQNTIFGQGDEGMNFMKPRTVEELRFVTHQKFFYKTSYYYLNKEKFDSLMGDLKDYLIKYVMKTKKRCEGYLVKVFIPSSYHTISMAKALPYPVEFQMRQPLVLSVGMKTPKSWKDGPSLEGFHLDLKPSMYLARVFTHQMKNLRDCHEVGVYHTHKIGMTYPFELKYEGMEFPNITLKYNVSGVKNKNILYYFTEAGTFEGAKDYRNLPMYSGKRVPILTQPTPFKFVREVSLVGVPPFRVEVFSEDINLFRQRMPRTPTEALDMAVQNILNAGWRYKSANITVTDDRNLWTGESESTFEVTYSRTHEQQRETASSPREKHASSWNRHSRSSSWQQNSKQSEKMWRGNVRQSEDDEWTTRTQDSDWVTDSPWDSETSRHSDDDDDDDGSNTQWPTRRQTAWSSDKSSHHESDDWEKYVISKDDESMEIFSQNAVTAAHILSYESPHIRHKLNIGISAKGTSSKAYVSMDYIHTYNKTGNLVRVKAVSHPADQQPFKVFIDHIMGYINKPDELHYGRDFGEQYAYFRTAISWSQNDQGEEENPAFNRAGLAAHGFLSYKSNKEALQADLLESVDDKYFMPETRDECLRDIRDGKPLSSDCMKAVREHSALNSIDMIVLWKEELPQDIKQIARVADVYLKHYYFEHMRLEATELVFDKYIVINMNYIDKFVDEPVADWKIIKTNEVVHLDRIPVRKAQPFSSVYSMNEALLLQMTNNTYPARCMLSDKYVKTYDLVSYPFRARQGCYYVLSAHCAVEKNFAILLHDSNEVRIHVANTKIFLLPNAGKSEGYTVKHDDRNVSVKDAVVFDTANDIYAYVETYKSHQHLRVIAKKAGINVLYDGTNVKIQVSPRYKGELCGLCSEFDGEGLREFRGLDRCLYTDHVDFADSNLIRRTDRCQPERNLHDRRLCEDAPARNDRRYTDLKTKDEPSFQRNVVIYRGDEVCFSVRPVAACQVNTEPSEMERQRIGFHCLPRDDLTAKKMTAEAEWRPLDELRRKSVDHVQTVDVPKMC